MPRRHRASSRRAEWAWERWLVRGLLFMLLFPVAVIAALRWIPPPVSSFMIGTKLDLIAAGARDTRIRYRWVDYERIAPTMRLAVVAAEDQRFNQHSGFDWDAIGKAMQHNQRSERTRGASTITQQVAKNLFLWEERSWLRKGVETYLTFWIEVLWPKQRILEVYLNVAQFGPTVFGVGAAAPNFFSRPPAQLSSAQAALLAGVLPAPRRLLVQAPSGYLRQRQAWIQRQMNGLGYRVLREIEGRPVPQMASSAQKPVPKPARPRPPTPKPAPVVAPEVVPPAPEPELPSPPTSESVVPVEPGDPTPTATPETATGGESAPEPVESDFPAGDLREEELS